LYIYWLKLFGAIFFPEHGRRFSLSPGGRGSG
jgi:hypothetical protein